MKKNILVIKLGALGDFIQAAPSFAAIRDHHKQAKVTLLTTEPYADFAARSPWFDDVWIDARPKAYDLLGCLGLRSRMISGNFERVYDLQTSDRSSYYFRLFWPTASPEWSGIAAGCSHPHTNPNRDFIHTFDRQAEQLGEAGISYLPEADFSWVCGNLTTFDITGPYVILAPGGAKHRPGKRWPLVYFWKLAQILENMGLQPVVVGDSEETSFNNRVLNSLSNIRNLTGRTSLDDLFLLAKNAHGAIGNDTGPMHIFSAVGCSTLVLFSGNSNPDICAQRGSEVKILRKQNLPDLSVTKVVEAFTKFMPS